MWIHKEEAKQESSRRLRLWMSPPQNEQKPEDKSERPKMNQTMNDEATHNHQLELRAMCCHLPFQRPDQD